MLSKSLIRSLLFASLLVQLLLPGSAVAEEPAAVDPGEATAEDERPRSTLLRELRTAEAEVHELKERVFRSKATLQLLRELSVEGARSGAGLRITHTDALKRAYAVESIQYYLNGKNIWSWSAGEGSSSPPRRLQVRDAAISPGSHSLQVSMVLRGDGRGVFEYLDDYRFTVDSSYTFDVDGGEVTDLTVKAISKGGVKKSFVERPTVVYEERRAQLEAE